MSGPMSGWEACRELGESRCADGHLWPSRPDEEACVRCGVFPWDEQERQDAGPADA